MLGMSMSLSRFYVTNGSIAPLYGGGTDFRSGRIADISAVRRRASSVPYTLVKLHSDLCLLPGGYCCKTIFWVLR